MSTTLEELIVKIDSDITGYKRGLADAEKRSENSGSKISNAFSRMGQGIGSAVSGLFNLRNLIMGGAVAYLMKQALDAADATAKLSRNIGISSKFLQEMTFAASQSGVEQATLNTSLTIFTRNIGLASSGVESAISKFADLGIEIKNADGTARTADQVFLDLADSMSKVDSAAEKAAIAQELFGRGGTAMIGMLDGGRDKIEAFQKEAARLGLVLGDNLLNNAEAAKDEMDKLQRVVGAQLNTVLLEMAPILTSVASNLVDLAASAQPALKTFAGLLQTTLDMMGVTNSYENQLVDLDRQIKKLESEMVLVDKRTENWRASLHGIGYTAKEAEEKKKSLRAEIDRLNLSYKDVIKQALNQKDAQQEVQRMLAESEKSIERLRQAESDRAKQLPENNKTEEEINNERIERINLLKELNEESHELEIKRLEQEVEKHKLSLETKLANQDAISNQELTHLKKFHDEKKKLDEAETKRLEEEHKKRWSAANNALSNLSVLQRSHSRTAQNIGKAAAIAQTTMSTYAAAQKSYEALAGIPLVGPVLGAAAAAAAIVAGIARVQQIRGIAFEKGGIVPGYGRGDKVPAMLEPREMVVPRDTTADLKKFLAANMKPGIKTPGSIRVEISLSDNAFELIEAKLIERRRLGISAGY